jgi:glycosyltransferase involved in cell wall biosynthesis
MKVLLATAFTLDPKIVGPAHTLVEIGRTLSALGIDTCLLTGDRQHIPPPLVPLSAWDIHDVRVVHNFGLWSPLSHAVSVATRLLKKPLVLAPIGMLEPWALSQNGRRKRLALSLYQRADLRRAAAIHVTAVVEAESVRAIGLRTPIALIPHGVHVPSALKYPKGSPQSPDEKVMLYLSRLHPKKGLLDLVEACGRLRPKQWRIVIAGPDQGGHRSEVEAAVRRHGLEHCISLVGAVNDAEKERLLTSADAFVLPTYSENFGLVVPEALAHGTPVLTTTGTPWSELATAKAGWWVDPGPESLTTALAEVFQLDRAKLRVMGEAGRRLVFERYSWTAVIRQHIDLYRWLDGTGAKPSFMLS